MDLSFIVELLAVWAFIFVEDLLRYFLAAGLLAYLLYTFSEWADRRRIQKGLANNEDRRREIRHSTLTIFIFSLTGLSIYGLSKLGLLTLNSEYTIATLVVEAILIIVAHDAYFYWMHRGLHASRRLMRVHVLHHRSKTPGPWAAYSFSAGEAVLEAVFLPIYALLMPMHGITAFIFTSHMIIRNVLGHAGVEMYPLWWTRHPLSRWITSTTHHDLHHAEFKHNFGLYFTWWDRWMGTEHPRYLEEFDRAHRVSKPELTGAGSRNVALLVLAIGFGLLLPTSKALAGDDELKGCWENSSRSMKVEFANCGKGYCGVLKHFAGHIIDGKHALKDVRNKRRRMRDRPLLGINLAHLASRRANSLWMGTVYRPDIGKLQKARFKVLDSGRLKIRACSGHICDSLYWYKVDFELCAGSL
ncbi:MAG: sterol desaturase family protein [Pseudomonadota bacterium]